MALGSFKGSPFCWRPGVSAGSLAEITISLIGSAWIGTVQVSSQLQAIVESNRLSKRDRTAADILGLSEVSSCSITRRYQKGITRLGDP